MPARRFSIGTLATADEARYMREPSLAPLAVYSMSSSWLDSISLMACALFELNDLRSKNSRGK